MVARREGQEATCGECGRKFEFRRNSGGTFTKCNSCSLKQRREKIRALTYEYKGNCCETCGYSKSIRALNFHHRDPKTKSFGIANAYCRSWEKIKLELDKCMLLCANCHAELHDQQGPDGYGSRLIHER